MCTDEQVVSRGAVHVASRGSYLARLRWIRDLLAGDYVLRADLGTLGKCVRAGRSGMICDALIPAGRSFRHR
jgi:hypothetical protein